MEFISKMPSNPGTMNKGTVGGNVLNVVLNLPKLGLVLFISELCADKFLWHVEIVYLVLLFRSHKSLVT